MVTGYLMLNKNIIISLTISMTISAIVAQIFSTQDDYLNSTFTLISGYFVYYSIFTTLYYRDNKKAYKTELGNTDTARLKMDLKKIILTIGIAEVSFLASKWTSQYYLLTQDFEPYAAAILAHLVGSALLLAMMNLTAKKTHLYK